MSRASSIGHCIRESENDTSRIVMAQLQRQGVVLAKRDVPLNFQYCRTPGEFFRLAFDKLNGSACISVAKEAVSSYFTDSGMKTAKLTEEIVSPLHFLGNKEPEATSMHSLLTSQIPDLYQLVKENLKHLVKITAGRRQPSVSRLYKTIQLLSDGMLSEDEQVAMTACQLVVSFARAVVRISSDFRPYLWTWFSYSSGGLKVAETSYFHHSDTCLRHMPFIDWILAFCQGHLSELFKDLLPVKLGSPLTYLAFVHKLLDLTTSSQIVAVFGDQVVFQHLIDFALHYSGIGSDLDVRFEAVSLMAKIWLKLPGHVQQVHHSEIQIGTAGGGSGCIAESILDSLRMGCRDPRSVQIQIASHAALFILWDAAAVTGHIAPDYQVVLWDMLVFSMFGNRSCHHVYRYIVSSFCRWLPLHHNLDLDSIVYQLGRQVKISGLMNVDVDFLLVIAQHSALTVQQGVALLELLGYLAVDDVLFGRLVTLPFIVLLCRFKREQVVLKYVQDYTKALATSLRQQQDDSLIGQLAHTEYYKRSLAIELLAKILHLQLSEFELLVDDVKELLWKSGDSCEDIQSLSYFIPMKDKDESNI